MSLKERLTEDMKGALKARDSLLLTTLRMALAALKNKAGMQADVTGYKAWRYATQDFAEIED